MSLFILGCSSDVPILQRSRSRFITMTGDIETGLRVGDQSTCTLPKKDKKPSPNVHLLHDIPDKPSPAGHKESNDIIIDKTQANYHLSKSQVMWRKPDSDTRHSPDSALQGSTNPTSPDRLPRINCACVIGLHSWDSAFALLDGG